MMPCLKGARLEIPDKLLKPTFPPSPYIARKPHTPVKSPPFPGLAHWTNSKKSQRWGLEYTGPLPAKNERTIQPEQQTIQNMIYHVTLFLDQQVNRLEVEIWRTFSLHNDKIN